jgi:hypothetical protein
MLEGAPSTTGFSSMLAQQTVRQFGGEISYQWDRDGLTVRLPLLRDRLIN